MAEEETRIQRQIKMNETINKLRELLDPYTPAEAFGILETAKLEIFAKTIKVANTYEGKK